MPKPLTAVLSRIAEKAPPRPYCIDCQELQEKGLLS